MDFYGAFMETEFVELGVYFSQLEAEVVKALLTENGIESRISKDDCGGMMPNLQFTEGVRLHVDRKDLDNARNLIDKDQTLAMDGDPENKLAESWTCTNCGEVLEAQFTDCWNCGTSS